MSQHLEPKNCDTDRKLDIRIPSPLAIAVPESKFLLVTILSVELWTIWNMFLILIIDK